MALGTARRQPRQSSAGTSEGVDVRALARSVPADERDDTCAGQPEEHGERDGHGVTLGGTTGPSPCSRRSVNSKTARSSIGHRIRTASNAKTSTPQPYPSVRWSSRGP